MNRLISANAIVLLLVLSTSAWSQWIDSLPGEIRKSILWMSDHEDRTLNRWQDPGVIAANMTGGILNTGGKDAVASIADGIAHSGRYSAAASIRNAFRAKNGNRAVRFMRWADRPWASDGAHFPKAAYYSTWMMIPHRYNSKKYPPWDPGDGGWWILFEFKSHDAKNISQTAWTLNGYYDDARKRIVFGLNQQLIGYKGYRQPRPIPVPIGKWVHVEAYYKVSSDSRGEVTIWQDGHKIFDVKNAKTALTKDREFAVWGLTNYTDHIAGGPKEGEATVYFDDAVVSTQRVSAALPTMTRIPKKSAGGKVRTKNGVSINQSAHRGQN